eukprot:2555-Pelagococcus_subviridis.AAC.2
MLVPAPRPPRRRLERPPDRDGAGAVRTEIARVVLVLVRPSPALSSLSLVRLHLRLHLPQRLSNRRGVRGVEPRHDVIRGSRR